jgi:hypothetical protein
MTLFVDQVLLQLSNSAQFLQLLTPAGDTTHTRLLTLLNAVYNLPFATIHDVRNVAVNQMEFQKLVFPTHYTQGTWTQTIPGYTRTDVTYEDLDRPDPVWIDIAAEVGLTLLLEADTGEIASITDFEVANFQTLADFQKQFRYIDLNAFMAEHNITTIDELRERYQYLRSEIQLLPLVQFDPNNPANLHSYTLNIATLIRDVIDVAATLRDAKLARFALGQALAYQKEVDVAEVQNPYAPLVIFSQTALTGLPFTTDALQTFFAGEGILALFFTPS